MISSDPDERPPIAQILNDPWIAEYNNLIDQQKMI